MSTGEEASRLRCVPGTCARAEAGRRSLEAALPGTPPLREWVDRPVGEGQSWAPHLRQMDELTLEPPPGAAQPSRMRGRASEGPSDRLRALVHLAALVTTTQESTDLIEAVAETALSLLAADSLSISQFQPERGELQTLINVGQLGAGEQRWPTNEMYRVADFPDTLGFLDGRPVRHLATCVDDERAEPAEARLLAALGKRSSLKAAIVLDGRVWGELWSARGASRAVFDEADGALAEVIVALVSAGLAQANAWRQMQVLAGTDSLTGLANRRAMDEHLVRHVSRCRAMRLPVAVVVADLNGLKRVNDTYGHAAGDDAIIRAATAAASSIAGLRDALAARLGGDEYALVLPAVSAEVARQVAVAWCRRAAHPTYLTSLACGVAIASPPTPPTPPTPPERRGGDPTVSLETPGPSRSRDDEASALETARALLACADRAQYDAKRGGATEPLIVTLSE